MIATFQSPGDTIYYVACCEELNRRIPKPERVLRPVDPSEEP